MYNVGSMKHLPSWPFEGPAEWILRARAGFGYADVSPLDELKRASGAPKLPVLFIHGTADELVPYKMLGELFSAAACEKESLTVEGAGHALSSSVEPEMYWSTVERFVEKYIGS